MCSISILDTSFNRISPDHFRALNIRGPPLLYHRQEIAIDLKLGVVLVHNKRTKFYEKSFNDIIIFLMTSSNLIDVVQNPIAYIF